MPYIIGNGKNYVKRTCTRYGPFYGKLATTEDKADARIWTRKSDAENMLSTIQYHAGIASKYPADAAYHRAREFYPGATVEEL